jgi:hypothetical protein
MATMKRKDIKQKLEEKALEIPLDILLTGKRNRNLTKKMQGFAVDLATGETKAQAYRNNYNSKGKPKTQSDEGSRLAKNPAIAAEVDLITEALEAAAAHTAAQLRGLVIGRLTQEAINMESPAAARITALKALGQVSEIAAFTERKEITQVKASDDIKAQLLRMIQGAMTDQVRTVDQDYDQDAAALMAAIARPAPIATAGSAHPPEADPPNPAKFEGGNTHSNPHKQSQSETHLSTLTDTNKDGEGVHFSESQSNQEDTEKAPPSVSKAQG